MEPNPREVANRLLLRDQFKPATSLNVLACWIQFQNHDWFGHGENDPENFIEVELPPNDDWPDGDVMKVKATAGPHPHRQERPAADLRQHRHPLVGPLADLRVHRGAKPRAPLGRGRELKIEDGMLPEETDRKLKGVDLTGFSTTTGSGSRCSTRCSPRSTTRSATT